MLEVVCEWLYGFLMIFFGWLVLSPVTVYRFDEDATATWRPSVSPYLFGYGATLSERNDGVHMFIPEPESNRVRDVLLSKNNDGIFTEASSQTLTGDSSITLFGQSMQATSNLLFIAGLCNTSVFAWNEATSSWHATPTTINYPLSTDQSAIAICANEAGRMAMGMAAPYATAVDGVVATSSCRPLGSTVECDPVITLSQPELVSPFGFSAYLGWASTILPSGDLFVSALYNGSSFQGSVVNFTAPDSVLGDLVNKTIVYRQSQLFEPANAQNDDRGVRSTAFTLTGSDVTHARDGDCLLWSSAGISRVYIACASTYSVTWIDAVDPDGPDASMYFGRYIYVSNDIVGVAADSTITGRDLTRLNSKLWLYRIVLNDDALDVSGDRKRAYVLEQIPTNLPKYTRYLNDTTARGSFTHSILKQNDSILIATRHKEIPDRSTGNVSSLVTLVNLTPRTEFVLRPELKMIFYRFRSLTWGAVTDSRDTQHVIQWILVVMLTGFFLATSAVGSILTMTWVIWHVILAIGNGIIAVGVALTFLAGTVHSLLQLVKYAQGRAQRTATKAELAQLNITPSNPLYRLIFSFYIPPSQIQETTLIASGGFGSVSRAVYKGQVVAVKKMHELIQSDPKAMDEFAREARSLVNLRHRHVVGFVGATLKLPNIFLVTEYCALGSLDDYMSSLKGKQRLDGRTVVQLVTQAAEGLAFIHSKNFIHRDVKAANFFVGVEDYVALGRPKQRIVVKVGDLGLAVSTKNKTISNVGTPGYSAPEVHQKTYTNKVDVFSFGVTMWACFSGREPFDDIPDAGPMQILQLVAAGKRPPLDAVPQEIGPLIRSCWEQDASDRPSMRDVVTALRGLKEVVMTANPVRAGRRPGQTV
ncbi:Serine/threonine-protein kinase [Carpediemonas membranifera]|uniref:Serine/threonine-protein kinase n=1 Tax=Carpediemonas membranifera TaxID=201153 RepID=A0A8J6B3W5_9EUKA|nr:Serine/threonine-protein kinase [Carpediemonas membranifera]|eukprot:KAG9389502.1 Serine/threonine-protein kinase [Carpediemonas membranifera]